MKTAFSFLFVLAFLVGCAKPKPYPPEVKQAMVDACMGEGVSELGCTCVAIGFETYIPLKRVKKNKLKEKDYENLSKVMLACALLEGNQNFTKEKIAGLGDPEVVIQNDSEYNLVLNIAGPQSGTVSITPRSDKAFKLTAGTYTVEAYSPDAPGVTPYKGSEVFDIDYRYTWKFYIQSQNAPTNTAPGGRTR